MEQENNTQKLHANTRGSFFWVVLILLIFFLSAIFGSVFGIMSSGLMQKFAPKIFKKLSFGGGQNVEIIRQNIVNEDTAIIDVVEKSSPAVVSILISKNVSAGNNSFFEQFGFPNFFGVPENSKSNLGEKQTIGQGSGFLITADGIIVTNKHVVSDAEAEYTVKTSDNQEHSASVLGKDPINDIAILKIEGTAYPTLALGDSDSLKVGQTVIAIGNSLGEFSNTVSRGIVSGLQRDVVAGAPFQGSEKLMGIIQTDAAINPGNSGGPLLNIDGEVVGINVAMAQGAESIGFALPSNQIKKIVEEVKTTGKITVPYLGVRYVPIDKQMQAANNLPFDYGVVIVSGQLPTELAIIPGSPADKAGLIQNDIILEIDGTKIDAQNTLSEMIAKDKVGDVITLKIWRKGVEMTLSATLEQQ